MSAMSSRTGHDIHDGHLNMDQDQTNNVLVDINHLIRIDLIADMIFNYLPIEELNNSRLVCKLWDEKICEILRKSWTKLKMIELFQVEKFDKFRNDMEGAREKRIFCQFYAKLDNFLSFGQQFFGQHEPKLLKVHLNRPLKGIKSHRKRTRIQDLLTLLKWSAGSLKELHIKGVSDLKKYKIPARPDLLKCTLPVLEQITINLKSWTKSDQVDQMMYRTFCGIVQKAPNLNSLVLDDASATRSCNFLKDLKRNTEILSKLQKFHIYYNHSHVYDDDDDDLDDDDVEIFEHFNEDFDGKQRIGPMDLIEMQENGLRNLTNFHLKLNFFEYKSARLSVDFDHISKFIQGVSAHLKTLELNIGVDKKSDISSSFKINLPILPKLEKLFLGNQDEFEDTFYFPYASIDLSAQFPVLHEIRLGLRDPQFSKVNFSEMFTGSSQTVQIFRIEIYPSLYEVENPPSYLPLEIFFPNVKKFEVDDNFKFVKGEGKNPWEKSLEIISINIFALDDLDFNIFTQFKELERIELTNSFHDWRKWRKVETQKFDMESFKKLRIKSFKIHHFLLSPEDVKQIQANCNFDYCSERREIKNSYYTEDD